MNELQIAQLVALILAGLFFVYKLAQGWLIVNLSLSATTARVRLSDEEDALAVSVTVTKGTIGSVRIDDTSVRVSCNSKTEATELVGTSRLLLCGDERNKIHPNWEEQDRGSYRLPPGEATIWSCLVTVPSHEACTVEAVILGHQRPSRAAAQWRCSVVSLPVAVAEARPAPQ